MISVPGTWLGLRSIVVYLLVLLSYDMREYLFPFLGWCLGWWSSGHSMFSALSWASSVSRSFAAWSNVSKVASAHWRDIVMFGG